MGVEPGGGVGDGSSHGFETGASVVEGGTYAGGASSSPSRVSRMRIAPEKSLKSSSSSRTVLQTRKGRRQE